MLEIDIRCWRSKLCVFEALLSIEAFRRPRSLDQLKFQLGIRRHDVPVQCAMRRLLLEVLVWRLKLEVEAGG